MSFLNTRQWSLSKYAKWETGEWKLINSEPSMPLFLIQQDLQLLVIHGNSTLESISLAQTKEHQKSMYNNGTLVMSIKHEEKSRKFRVLFPSLLEGEQCVVELRRFMDIGIAEGSRPIVDKRLEPLSVVMSRILKKNHHSLPSPESIPDEYPLEAAVQLCILDPGFPNLVQRIDSIISKHATSSSNIFQN